MRLQSAIGTPELVAIIIKDIPPSINQFISHGGDLIRGEYGQEFKISGSLYHSPTKDDNISFDKCSL